ncbi:MAG: metal-dependent hydrolase [Candidatus Hodarchaeota archaeon]
MTLIPTHLSLGAILFWTFIPSTDRETFQQKKVLFWLVISFTILPDLDIFFAFHRGLFHSIITPTLLTLFGTVIHYYYQYMNSNSESVTGEGINKTKNKDQNFWGRCIFYGGILCVIHIFLDLEYPIALFYPLSDRLYQINLTYIINLTPWLFFPATIAGLGLDITGVSYLRGITTFFINLPPETRKQIFGGTTATFPVDNFFLHFLLFFIFLVYVAKPMIPPIELRRLSEWRKKINFDGPILGLGILLVIIGVLIGPLIGPNIIDTSSVSSTFQVSPTVFSPMIAHTFETTNFILQPNMIHYIRGNLTTTSENDTFDQKLLLITLKDYSDFSNKVSQIFQQFPFNTTENTQNFEVNYSNLLNSLDSTSLARNITPSKEMTLEAQLSGGSYTLMGVIENWNFTQVLNGTQLSESTELRIRVTSSRSTVLAIGFISILAGISVTIVSYRLKKGESINPEFK